MAKGIKLNSKVNGLGGKCRIVNMEGVSTFMGFHTWVNNRVQIDNGAANIEWYEHVRGKQSTQAGSVQ
jgi:hypothetical protein